GIGEVILPESPSQQSMNDLSGRAALHHGTERKVLVLPDEEVALARLVRQHAGNQLRLGVHGPPQRAPLDHSQAHIVDLGKQDVGVVLGQRLHQSQAPLLLLPKTALEHGVHTWCYDIGNAKQVCSVIIALCHLPEVGPLFSDSSLWAADPSLSLGLIQWWEMAHRGSRVGATLAFPRESCLPGQASSSSSYESLRTTAVIVPEAADKDVDSVLIERWVHYQKSSSWQRKVWHGGYPMALPLFLAVLMQADSCCTSSGVKGGVRLVRVRAKATPPPIPLSNTSTSGSSSPAKWPPQPFRTHQNLTQYPAGTAHRHLCFLTVLLLKSRSKSSSDVLLCCPPQDAHEFLMLCLLQLKEEGERLRASFFSYICPVANFEFHIKSVLTCASCGKQSCRVDVYNYLSVNLSPATTHSLHTYFKPTLLERFCECEAGCKATEEVDFFHTATVSLVILVLHIKRFDMLGQKLSDVMDVPSELDLSALPGVASVRQQWSGAAGTQEKPQEKQNDKLGENSSPQPGPPTTPTGHYISDTAEGEGQSWLSFSDLKVSRSTEPVILKSRTKKQLTCFSTCTAHLCIRLHVTGTPTVEGCLEPRERRKRRRSSVAAPTQPMQENPPYLWEHSLPSHRGRVSLEDFGGALVVVQGQLLQSPAYLHWITGTRMITTTNIQGQTLQGPNIPSRTTRRTMRITAGVRSTLTLASGQTPNLTALRIHQWRWRRPSMRILPVVYRPALSYWKNFHKSNLSD
ncbi:hypothetical protein P4O66_008219, partial [Electrophorus voltai]